MAGLCDKCGDHHRNVSKDFDSTSVFAAQVGHANCLRILIEMGADLNHPNTNHDGPLIWAVLGGREECVKILVQAGADVNKRSRGGYTPLMLAAREGHDKCTDVLLKTGTDVNIAAENGETPLMRAARNNQVACMDLLIKAGADVNALDENHSTALIAAAEGFDASRIKCLRLLLGAGAKINKITKIARNKHNALQSHIYKKQPDRGICMLLFAAGEKIDGTHVEGLYDSVKVPDYLLLYEDLNLNLKQACRETIRKHLTNIDPEENLLCRIPQLGLPGSLASYLFYNVSLE